MVLSSAVQLCWSRRERTSDLVRMDDADIVDILVRGFGRVAGDLNTRADFFGSQVLT